MSMQGVGRVAASVAASIGGIGALLGAGLGAAENVEFDRVQIEIAEIGEDSGLLPLPELEGRHNTQKDAASRHLDTLDEFVEAEVGDADGAEDAAIALGGLATRMKDIRAYIDEYRGISALAHEGHGDERPRARVLFFGGVIVTAASLVMRQRLK